MLSPFSARLAQRFPHAPFLALSLALASLSLPPLAYSQQTINVANGDVAGFITAIQTLNANGGGTIDLATDGTYSVTAPSDWWYGPNAFPAIASPITINGNGSTISRAAGSPKFRFFYVSGGFSTLPAGFLTLTDMTLSGGLAQGGNGAPGQTGGGGGAGLGGAIYNQGTLLLNAVTLSLNTALGGSGGSVQTTSATMGGGGGGLGGDGDGSGGGGGFKTEGSGGAGGSFQGNEGGAACSTGGTSNFGGNGGAGIGSGGGSGGGYEPGQNGSDEGGPAGLGGGGSYSARDYGSGCAGGGGAFGGGGGGYGVPGSGGVGGGGGGLTSNDGGGLGTFVGSGGFGGGAGGFGYANLPILPGGPQEFRGSAGAIAAEASSLYVECYNSSSDNPGGGGCFTGGFGGGGGGVQLGEGQPEHSLNYTVYAGFGGGAGGNSASVNQFANSGGGGGAGMGGAIFNHGGLAWISNSSFISNAAQGGAPAGTAGTSDGFGGAIFNLDGLVQLNDASYSGDTATNSAAGGDQGPFIYNLSGNMGVTGPNQSPAAYLFLNSTTLASSSDVQNSGVNGPAVVSATETVTPIDIVFSSGGTLSSIQPSTLGLANQDFILAGNGSCIIGTTFSTSDTCTAFLWVAPLFAGFRQGAVMLTDANGNVLGTGYVAATGQFPQITYSSMSSQGIGSGWNFPVGVAVDGAGSVYVADSGNNRVVKAPFSNGSFGTPVTLASGGNPNAVAVDGAGNVFYTNSSSAMEVPFNGTSYGAPTSISDQLSPGWNYPTGVAVDGAGDLFVLDSGNDQVVEVPRTATGFGAGVVIGQNDFINPVSLAVDGAENVYVADSGYINISGYAAVYQFPYSGGSWGGPNSIGSGYTEYLSNVAVDATGDLYVSDEGAGNVVRFPWTGTGLGNPATMLSGQWNAVAVDNLGNIYGAAYTPQVTKYTVTNPPSFNFPTATQVGQIDTTDGSQTVSIFNIGNQPLVFSTPTTGGNPNYPANFPENTGDGNLCASGTPLAEGATCDMSMNFMPNTAGTNTGSVVLTDNALNQANATQSISLTGANNQQNQTIDFTPPASPVDLGVSPITLVATGGASGNPVVFTVLSGPGAVSGTNGATLTITGTGTVVIAANQAGNASYTAAPQVTQSLVVDPPLAVLTSPTPGLTTKLGTTNVTFQWTTATGATEYQFNLSAIAPGESELFLYKGTATSATAATLPANNVPVYATMYSKINGVWYSNAYEYTESGTPTPAALTSPTPGITTILGATNVVFQWITGTNVSEYQLNLSAIASGDSELFSYKGTALTATAATLPANGVTVYATLYSKINGVWQTPNSYVFTESGTPTPAALTSPTPGLSTILGTSDVTFQWNAGIDVTDYQLNLSAIAAGDSELCSYKGTALTATATSLPGNGAKLYARLYSKINGAWQYNDYQYTEGGTPTPAALTSPTPGLSTILGTTNVIFQWNAGIAVTDYQLNLSAIAAGDSELYLYKGTALTATATTLPGNGVTVYARLYSKINGAWQYNDYQYTEGGTPTAATLTSPTPGAGSILGTSNVTFQWTAGIAVTDYQLNLSAIAPGDSELYLYKGTALTATATSLPANGVTVYARLYSKINGVWQYNDYVYTEQ